MVITVSELAPVDQQLSLRGRKKLATRLALRRATIDLVAAHGFANVTVEDIVGAADVSPRTFFNYFTSKEAALLGLNPERMTSLHQRLVDQPKQLSAARALQVVLLDEARMFALELTALGGNPGAWFRRIKAVANDPHVLAAQAAHMSSVERVLTTAIAERLHTDTSKDPYPALLACAFVGTLRTTVAYWATSASSIPLEVLTQAAFKAIEDGLPELCELRTLAKTAESSTRRLANTKHSTHRATEDRR